MLKTSAPSCGPPRSALIMSPSTCCDAVAHPLLRDDAPPDRGAARQVEHRRAQRRMAPAQLGRVPAVPAGDVEQRLRPGRQPQRLRDLRRADARQLELPADVLLPVRIVGREVVDLDALAGAHDVLEPVPPAPVVEAVLDVGPDVVVRGRVEPLARAAFESGYSRRCACRRGSSAASESSSSIVPPGSQVEVRARAPRRVAAPRASRAKIPSRWPAIVTRAIGMPNIAWPGRDRREVQPDREAIERGVGLQSGAQRRAARGRPAGSSSRRRSRARR